MTKADDPETQDQAELLRAFMESLAGSKRSWIWVWLPGLFALAVFIIVALYFAELETVVYLIKGARAEWLIPAMFAQLATYFFEAAVWWRALIAFGFRMDIKGLVPLAFAKLFMDQAFPMGGISGTLVAAAGLVHRTVPFDAALLTLLTSLISYYAVYSLVAIFSLLILVAHHLDNIAIWFAVACLVVVAAIIPVVAIFLKKHGRRMLPAWVRKFRTVRGLLDATAKVSTARLKNPLLLAETSGFQATVFLLDGITLWIAFKAIGSDVAFPMAFAAHVLGTVTATLGPIPLGLGTFEGGAVAVLALVDVPVEVGLSAVLLTRALTFWLPMLPGLWLARREINQAGSFLVRGTDLSPEK